MRAATTIVVSGIFVLCAFGTTHAQQVLEQFSGTATIVAELPGAESGGSVEFDYRRLITSLDFAPGAVDFHGVPIDFDGTEAAFLAVSYTGTYVVPATSGPATVDVTGTETLDQSAELAVTLRGVELGSGFSATSFDLEQGQAIPFTQIATTPWSSPLIPELNGEFVSFRGTMTVLAVDAVGGIVDVRIAGETFIGGPPGPEVEVPALSLWGLAALGATMGAIGRRRLLRR